MTKDMRLNYAVLNVYIKEEQESDIMTILSDIVWKQ